MKRTAKGQTTKSIANKMSTARESRRLVKQSNLPTKVFIKDQCVFVNDNVMQEMCIPEITLSRQQRP